MKFFPVLISADTVIGFIEIALEWLGITKSKSSFPISAAHKKILEQRLQEVSNTTLEELRPTSTTLDPMGYQVRFHPKALREFKDLQAALPYADQREGVEKEVLRAAQTLQSQEFVVIRQKEIQIYALRKTTGWMYLGLWANQKRVVVYFLTSQK
ncbi:MAG TPA: hypothetical protein DCE41_27215 [Cytophagales bacterium]|nr:hypothetical protein [Cytophagales bacterium]HAA21939.1 hypothetical protein [Cytophagales bacterium]HAP61364.1 hypothetical protein [Cytophagales bacterium]